MQLAVEKIVEHGSPAQAEKMLNIGTVTQCNTNTHCKSAGNFVYLECGYRKKVVDIQLVFGMSNLHLVYQTCSTCIY